MSINANSEKWRRFRKPFVSMRVLHDIIMILFSATVRYFCSIDKFFRFTVIGKSNLPDGPFVICANHASHLDYIALVEAMGISYTETIAIAATDFHFDRSPRSYVLRKMFNLAPLERGGLNSSPLARASSLLSCARDCRSFLDQGGRAVILYPEGSRSLNGQIQTFKSGVYPILQIIGYPVVPVYIDGTFRVFSKTRLLPRLGPLSVRFGVPKLLNSSNRTSGPAPDAATREGADFVAAIEAAVRELAHARMTLD